MTLYEQYFLAEYFSDYTFSGKSILIEASCAYRFEQLALLIELTIASWGDEAEHNALVINRLDQLRH